jgi:predicted dehydrogenase
MSEKIRTIHVGMIGCGVAAERHLAVLARTPGVRVVAVADVDGERLARVAKLFGIARTTADYRHLLGRGDVEAVVVAVPTEFHAEAGVAALEAGKHLLMEKPLAATLEDCDRLVACGARARARAMVGFNMRFHRLARLAREMVQDGAIGAVKAVKSSFTHWRTAPSAWKRQRTAGGGVILNESVHHLDLWRFLLGSEIAEVAAASQSSAEMEDETAVVTARMANGALATGAFSLKTSPDNAIGLYGERGRLCVSLYRFDGLEFFSNQTLPGDIGDRLRKMAATAMELPRRIPTIRRGGDFAASYDAEWRHFLDCVREGRNPGCSLEDGRHAVRAALAAVESARSGRVVPVTEGGA